MTQAISTIKRIVEAPNWNQRVAQIRLIPQHHGTGEHAQIFAEIARLLYVPHLAPDFAYIHEAPFYEQEYFAAAYDAAHRATRGFTEVSEDNLKKTIESDPGFPDYPRPDPRGVRTINDPGRKACWAAEPDPRKGRLHGAEWIGNHCGAGTGRGQNSSACHGRNSLR